MMSDYNWFEFSFTFTHGLEVFIAVIEEFVPISAEAPFAKGCVVYLYILGYSCILRVLGQCIKGYFIYFGGMNIYNCSHWKQKKAQ